MNQYKIKILCNEIEEINADSKTEALNILNVNTTRKNFDKIVNKTSRVYDKIEVINKRLDLIDKKIDNINECLIKLINRGII